MRSSTAPYKVGVFVVIATVFISVISMGAASALTPGVAFSAANLSTWQTNGVVWAVGQSHGKVVAGGDFTQLRPPEGGVGAPVSVQSLAILDAQTGAPDKCQMDVALIGGTPTVRAITTSADGNTVYVGGNFSSLGGAAVARVAAIDVQSCTVKSLRTDAITSFVHTLAVKNNTLYIGGEFTSVSGQPRQHFAALDATTGALLPWVANADATGRAIGVSPDGTKVAIGGDFFNVNGAYSHSIAVVNATTGANVRTYASGFIPDLSVTKNIFSGNDGRFYVSNEGSGHGVFDGRIAMSWDTLDEVWRDTCLGATQATYEYRGTLYVASHAHDCKDNSFQDGKRNFFMAEKASTSELLGWDPTANDGTGEGIGPRSITVATGSTTGSDYLWYGGEFTQVNGAPQQGLTRFGPDDTIAPPAARPAAETMSEGAIQVRWRAVVDPDDSELTYEVFRNGSTTPIWTDKTSSVWWKRPQVSFVDTAVTPGTTYSYRVRVSDGTNLSPLSDPVQETAVAAAPSYASSVRADQPSAYWNSRTSDYPVWVHDAGASTSDGRRLEGINQGATASTDSPVAGDASGSLSFDGIDNYFWNDEYVPAPTTYSEEAWIKTTTTTGGEILGYGDGRPRTDSSMTKLSTAYDRQLYMENTGQVRFGVNPGTYTSLRSPTALNDGQWHHLVASQGASGMALYVDGKLVASNATTGAKSYKGVWHVGGDNLSGSTSQPTSNFFKGRIDETALYPTALSASNVAAHFQASTAVSGGASDTQAPTVPANVTATEAGPGAATVSWQASTDNVAVTGYSVYRGTSAGFAVGSASLVASTATNSYADSGLSAGTYYYKVTARDAANNSSAASSEAAVTVSAQASTVVLSPTADALVASGAPATNYGAYNQLSTLSGTGVLQSFLKFNLPQAPAGTALTGVTLKVTTSTDPTAGSTAPSAVELVSNPWTESTINWGNRPTTVGAKLATLSGATATNTRYQAVGTAAALKPALGSAVSLRLSTASSDNLRLWSKEATYAPSRPSLTLTFTPTSTPAPDTTAPSSPSNVGTAVSGSDVTVSWNASTDAVGVAGYTLYRGTSADFVVGAGTKVADVTTLSYKDQALKPGTYFYKVVARDAAGNSSQPSAAATATVTDQAPTTPTNVSTQVVGSNVTLSWTASTDDVGVAGYSVYRGASAGFAVDSTSKIADVSTTTYSDPSLAPGTYYYKVVARDTAGNTSGASAAATATVGSTPPPAQGSTVVLSATDDALVNSGVPTTNYGAYNQLSTRGGTAVLESFLKFNLPQAPAGTTLTGVTLKLTTSTDPTAGSVDPTAVELVSNPWTESTVTWDNRPTTVGAKLGTLTGATATNTDYQAVGTPAALKPALGSAVSLRLSTTSTDNLRLWSNNADYAPNRPTLTLTFTPTP